MPLAVRGVLEEPFHYPDKLIRFSFSKCDFKRHCISKLQSREIERVYCALGRFEKLTWGALKRIPRESGISIDKKSGVAYELLKSKMPDCSSFGHFRVGGTDMATRVFVGIREDLVFILLFDREGRLQGH